MLVVIFDLSNYKSPNVLINVLKDAMTDTTMNDDTLYTTIRI